MVKIITIIAVIIFIFQTARFWWTAFGWTWFIFMFLFFLVLWIGIL